MILFFRKSDKARHALLMSDARPGIGIKDRNDSGMAPQAIEIA
jgi:hypothetical protein